MVICAWRAVLATALASLLVSCGGGGGDSTEGRDLDLVCPPLADLDGYVREDDVVFSAAPLGITVGDAATGGVEVRGILAFDITGLPAGAVVRAAVLQIEQYGIGGSPYPGFGTIVIDHVTLTPPLSSDDAWPPTLQGAFATVSANDTLGLRQVDVRSQVGADGVAARPRSCFQLRFTNPNVLILNTNGVDDRAHFNDAVDVAGTGNAPRLTVRYTPP